MSMYDIPHSVHDYLSWIGACLLDCEIHLLREYLRSCKQSSNKRVFQISGPTPYRVMVRDLLYLFSASRWTCLYCGDVLTLADDHLTRATIDHVIPIVTGGTNELANLVPCCAGCNHSKGGRSFACFITDRQGFVKRYVDMWSRYDYYSSSQFLDDLPSQNDILFHHISPRYRKTS